jgi:hypothetical protein
MFSLWWGVVCVCVPSWTPVERRHWFEMAGHRSLIAS